MSTRIYWHHPESCCVGFVTDERDFPQDGQCDRISQGEYNRLKAVYDNKPKPKPFKALRQEYLKGTNSRVYVGRTTAVKVQAKGLPTSIVIMANTDEELQRVVSVLLNGYELDKKLIVDGALVDPGKLKFEDEL